MGRKIVLGKKVIEYLDVLKKSDLTSDNEKYIAIKEELKKLKKLPDRCFTKGNKNIKVQKLPMAGISKNEKDVWLMVIRGSLWATYQLDFVRLVIAKRIDKIIILEIYMSEKEFPEDR